MATTVAFEVDVKDVEYQQLDGAPWLARVYRPLGAGPFPTIVDVHGGAWNNGDRTNDTVLDQALASRGILTVAIDFRQPPQAGYPASVQDMNLAIRWLKVHAAEYGGVNKVGALGVSSGGHLVLLGGIRPRDARYAALPLAGHPEVDASLAYVVACWPVSDPLYRYKKAQAAGNQNIVKSHDNYWGTEAAMEEGNPPLILERGEAVELPPTLVIQRKVDTAHPLEMQQRLVEWYRKRGGRIEMPLFDTIPTPFKISDESPDAARVVETIADFIVQNG
ncbi:MAG: alpha/beta hydrolase [Chloroflexi bacterium]|nr:alpha/beta hydrolase [Chloroflexota bacterium]MBV9600459.1 alpha/beta hydrolase [Chloroflexota bacterium]